MPRSKRVEGAKDDGTSDPLTMDNAWPAWLLSDVFGRGGLRWIAIGAKHRARVVVVATFVSFALLAVLVPRRALAEATPGASAAELYERAEHDDGAFAFSSALAEYEEAARLDPGAPFAARARARAAVLRARAEAGFAPLALLERVRRDPAIAADERAIDDLAHAADAFPAGLVRVEARMLAAEGYRGRFDRPQDAVGLWSLVLGDPSADSDSAAVAARSLVTHHLAQGDPASAERVLELAGTKADAKLASAVERAMRRHNVHIASIVFVTIVLVAASVAIAKAVRTSRRHVVLAQARTAVVLALVYAGYVAAVGAALASGYEMGTARPFVFFGMALVPLVALARAWGVAGSPRPSARVFRASACAASVLGAAFLVLERVDVAYLSAIGL